MSNNPPFLTPEQRIQRQCRFLRNRLEEMGVSLEAQTKILKIAEKDLRQKYAKIDWTQKPSLEVKAKDYGECICCRREKPLVDGFMYMSEGGFGEE